MVRSVFLQFINCHRVRDTCHCLLAPLLNTNSNVRIPRHLSLNSLQYRVFSHDVTAAILVSQNNETAAMLVSLTNPVGVELFSNANAFFCSNNLHRCWPREWKHSINGINKCINTIIFGPDANYWPGISRWPPIHTSGEPQGRIPMPRSVTAPLRNYWF